MGTAEIDFNEMKLKGLENVQVGRYNCNFCNEHTCHRISRKNVIFMILEKDLACSLGIYVQPNATGTIKDTY